MPSTTWTLLALVFLGATLIHGQETSISTAGYKLDANFPNFTVRARYPGTDTLYEDQYIGLHILSLDEGSVTSGGSGVTFTPERSIPSAELAGNISIGKWSSRVTLSNGTVSTHVDTMHIESILADGANFTINFERFHDDGFMPWGTNTVNVSHSKLKYTAFLNGWNFTTSGRRLRILMEVAYYTGIHGIQIPQIEQVDWNGPSKSVHVTWPPIDLIQAGLSCDAWLLADGVVNTMTLSPHPIRDGTLELNNDTVPRFMKITFGWTLPPFENSVAWDPTVLMKLFGDPPTPNNVPSSNKNGNKTVAILAGTFTAVVIVGVAAVIGTVILLRKNPYPDM